MLPLAIVLTGIGAAMSLDMRLIPNPRDGIVQAISDFTGKEMGLCKNWFDGIMITMALILSLAVRHRVVGVGIGRVIMVFNKLFLKKFREASGLV